MKTDDRLLIESIDPSILRRLMDAFASSQGIATSIFSTDCTRITGPCNHSMFCELIRASKKGGKEIGMERCEECDRQHFPTQRNTVGPYYCHAGLMDFSTPIVARKDTLIGAIFGGQVLDHKLTRTDLQKFCRTARRYGIDEMDLLDAAMKIPTMEKTQIRRVIKLTERIADTIADLVEKKANEHDFLLKLISTLDLGILSGHAIEYVHTILQAKHCSIFLNNGVGDNNRLVLLNSSSNILRKKIGKISYLMGEGLTGWVASEGQPLNIKNIHDSSELLSISCSLKWSGKHMETTNPARIYRFLAVPLLSNHGSRDRTIGVIRAIRDSKQQPFADTDIGTLRGLATLLVSAIENSESQQKATQRSEELEALSSAARSVNLDLGLEEVLDAIIRGGLQVMKQKGGDISLYVLLRLTDKKQFMIMAGGGEGFKKHYIGQRFPDKEGLAGYVLRKKRSCVVGNVSDNPHYTKIIENIRSAVVVPIQSLNKILGMLSLGSSREDTFHKDDATLLEGFAAHVSIALANAFALQNAESQVKVQEHAVEAITKGSGMEEVSQKIVEVTRDRLNARVCSLFLHDGKGQLILSGTTDHMLKRQIQKGKTISYSIGEGLTGWTAKVRDVLRINNVSDRSELCVIDRQLRWKNKFPEKGLDGKAEWKSFLGAPIRFNDALIGVIRLAQRKDSSTFLKQEEKTLQGIVRQAAVVLQFAKALMKAKTTLSQLKLAIWGFAHDAGTPSLSLFRDLEYQYTSKQDKALFRLYCLSEHIAHLVGTYKAIGETDRQEKIALEKTETFLLSPAVDRITVTIGENWGDRAGKIEITNDIPVDLEIEADRGKMHAIFYNLIANAVNACRKRVHIAYLADSKSWIFRIVDDGIGIGKFDIPSDPMTGHLGLYIAKKFVEAHGGCLRVKRLGFRREGTAATIRIPKKLL